MGALPQDAISALSLNHLQSVFYPCLLMLGVCLLFFVAEHLIRLCKKTGSRDKVSRLEDEEEEVGPYRAEEMTFDRGGQDRRVTWARMRRVRRPIYY